MAERIRKAGEAFDGTSRSRVEACVKFLRISRPAPCAALLGFTAGCNWLLARVGRRCAAGSRPAAWSEAERLHAGDLLGGRELEARAAALAALIAEEVAAIEAERDANWEELDGPLRQEAEDRALLDTSPEGQIRLAPRGAGGAATAQGDRPVLQGPPGLVRAARRAVGGGRRRTNPPPKPCREQCLRRRIRLPLAAAERAGVRALRPARDCSPRAGAAPRGRRVDARGCSSLTPALSAAGQRGAGRRTNPPPKSWRARRLRRPARRSPRASAAAVAGATGSASNPCDQAYGGSTRRPPRAPRRRTNPPPKSIGSKNFRRKTPAWWRRCAGWSSPGRRGRCRGGWSTTTRRCRPCRRSAL